MLNLEWLYKYTLAKRFYEENGNLLIHSNYVVCINNEKHNIGIWIIKQRKDYIEGKLDDRQIKLLNSINMIWDIKKFKDDTYKLYEMYELGLLDNFQIKESLKNGMFKEIDGKIKKYRYVKHKK